MRNALLCGLAAMLIMAPLLSQVLRLPDQSEPFSFKDDKLGMSLGDFKAKHLDPGRWEDEATKTVASSVDSHSPPPGRGSWKWKPDLDCKEPVKGVITRCEYTTTVAGIPWAHPAAVFVEGKLAVISVWYGTHSPLVQQALVDKLGPPARIPVSGHSNRDLFALRWDNGVSVVEFQEHYCGSGFVQPSREGWSKDVTEILLGTYCENEDAGDFSSAFIWYVHKSLSSLAVTRWKEAIEEVEKKARSEPFSLDDELGMDLEDFKAKHRNPGHWEDHPTCPPSKGSNCIRGKIWKPDMPCEETAKAITECHYFATILGISAHTTAIFADYELAALHLQYDILESHMATISGVRVPVDVKQALIGRFGPPEVIRGYGDSTYTGDERRALRWDNGVSVVEFQGNNCGGGNDYEDVAKILQRRYCDKTTDSGDGTDSIWYVHKALSGLVLTREKEAEENAGKKARSDL